MSELDDWRPIKTAPRNSDMVLLFGRIGRRIYVANSYWTLVGWANWSSAIEPTHWRPMLSIPHEGADHE